MQAADVPNAAESPAEAERRRRRRRRKPRGERGEVPAAGAPGTPAAPAGPVGVSKESFFARMAARVKGWFGG